MKLSQALILPVVCNRLRSVAPFPAFRIVLQIVVSDAFLTKSDITYIYQPFYIFDCPGNLIAGHSTLFPCSFKNIIDRIAL
jgi:hypothetical protein